MRLEDQISINKFGQGLVSTDHFLNLFTSFTLIDKKAFLKNVIVLIKQSKPKEGDIDIAIKESGLRPSFTPCVLLRKGIEDHHLQKIAELPEEELGKSLALLLSLFKISYSRRFESEKSNPTKWWYWDLSNEENVKRIIADNYFQ
jgi:hypothetical protein